MLQQGQSSNLLALPNCLTLLFWWQQCTNLQPFQAMERSCLCKQTFMAECRSSWSGSGLWKTVVTKVTQLEVPPPHSESGPDAASAINACADQDATVTAIMTANTDEFMQTSYLSTSRWRATCYMALPIGKQEAASAYAAQLQGWLPLAQNTHWQIRGNSKRAAHILT